MSDFNKPFWKDMQGKPAQELNPIQGNRLFDGLVAVIFGNESHFSMRQCLKFAGL